MSFIFYDTETTGTEIFFDQILQFAAIQTDAELKEIDRFEIRCRLLPHVVSAHATKSTIESRFKTAISGLTEDDSFIFFFAGHGLSINDENYLTCHDTQRGDLAPTSVRLDWIFNSLRKTKCKHAMFFLDCCHSGLPIDDAMRGIADHISDTEFETLFKNSEYHVAFAACKSDESSYPSNTLSHGIWTHHLLRALAGEAPDALDRGRYITSHSLQDYLFVEVPRTLRTTILAASARQTPCCFGNATSQFIIADLKPILDARQAALAGHTVTPQDAAFVGTKYGAIKSLSGFKRFHTVPKYVGPAVDRFLSDVGEDDLKNHTNSVLKSLRANLGYGIKDIDRSVSGNSAALKTKDFDVNISIFQDADEPETYAIKTEVTNFRTPAVVSADKFNLAVGGFVDSMELQLPMKFNLEDLIARLEKSSLVDSIEIDYDADLTDVKIEFYDTDVVFQFTNDICRITTNARKSPLELLKAVGETQALLLTSGSTSVPLLNP
jgi:hypothetical protein